MAFSSKSSYSTRFYNWTDVTVAFKEASSQLDIGELVKDRNFGLFEAMSAIEMMDPKMDAGMISNQSQSKIKSFQQAIDDSLIKCDQFTLEEKMAIVDATLSNLITWLDGASLAQTLFTNLYLHDPSQIKDEYLRVFSVAILKITDSMRNKILAADCYEEEDFQPMCYNFKFASDFTDTTVNGLLKTVEDNAAKLFRHLKGELCAAASVEDKSQVDLASALWIRIKFVRSFYQIMHYSDEHLSFSKNSGEIHKYINNCLESLAKIKEGHKSSSKSDQSTTPLVMGFEATVNQRLLPPTFPRFIRVYSFESTLEQFETILTQLKDATKVTDLTYFYQLFDFALEFSSRNESVFLRSFLQLIMFPRGPLEKITKLKNCLFETIQKTITPPILNPRCQLAANKEICIHFVDAFLNKCSPMFLALIQILGHNKARQREKLGNIIEDLATLQEEADNLDRILDSFFSQQKTNNQSHLAYFGSWILFNNLTIMNLYLVSGFELDLFSKFEYPYVYWYLFEVILNWQMSTLTRMDNFLLTNELNFPVIQPKIIKSPKVKS
jgi:hypothetical protein